MRFSAALFVACLAVAPALADQDGVLDGYELRELCGDLARTDYFKGVLDQARWSYAAPYCVPRTLPPYMLRDAVCTYLSLSAAPHTIGYPAPWHIREAFKASYPCPSDEPMDMGLGN